MSHVRQQRTSPANLGPRPPPLSPVCTRAHLGKIRPRARKRILYSQQLAHSFSRPKTPTIAFSETCALFHPRRKFNASVSNHFHTLRSLFCQRAKTNSTCFHAIAVRFCRNVGWGAKKERNSPLQERKSGKGSLRGKQVPNEFRSSSFTVQIRAGVGSTWSPRQRSLGSTWSPRQKKSGLYLGPTSKKSGLYLGPTSKKSGLYLQPAQKMQGTRAE